MKADAVLVGQASRLPEGWVASALRIENSKLRIPVAFFSPQSALESP
jgi:hypothetical protein